jgi:Uracil DNA glycosylase superfamily
MIDTLFDLVPRSVLSESGSVFYSGRTAFSNPSPLYILGLNPGGSPESQATETVEWHSRKVLYDVPAEWSEYSDECWSSNTKPGTCGLQPRVLHLLCRLGMDARHVPSSNLIFVRTRGQKDLANRFYKLANESWAFHERVIESLGIKVILCFGQRAGRWVATKVGAHKHDGEFVENNRRGWKTLALSNDKGMTVIVATHPSWANWMNSSADPTPLVLDVLGRARGVAQRDSTP